MGENSNREASPQHPGEIAVLEKVLLGVIVLLLGAIATQLWSIAAQHRASVAWLGALLAPKNQTLLDNILGKPNPTRTIIDQIAILLVESQQRLEGMDQKLAYFRNYLWEIHDPRLHEEVTKPRVSSRWKKAFGPRDKEETTTYGLWDKERDWDYLPDQILSGRYKPDDDVARRQKPDDDST